MTDLYDAFTWQNLLPLAGHIAAYRDGADTTWPPLAFQSLEKRILWNISVLADQAWEVFDSEAGNAGTDLVATAVANRFQDGKWSVCYTNADNLSGLTQSLRRKGMFWTDTQFYPEPGCYLWAASPGLTPGRTPPWCPVAPVAVQDRWGRLYNTSTLFIPVDPAQPVQPQAEQGSEVIYRKQSDGEALMIDGGFKFAVVSASDLKSFDDAGVKIINVSDPQFEVVRTVAGT